MSSVSTALKELFYKTVEEMIENGLETKVVEGHDFLVTKGKPKDGQMLLDRVERGDVFYYLSVR